MPKIQSNTPYTNRVSVLEWLVLLGCILMFTGFLCSRILLSTGMILMIVIGFRPQALRSGWKKFKSNYFGWFAILFFLTYFISGVWSANLTDWWQAVQLKLPFIFLPFAMLNLPFHKKRLQLLITAGIAILLLLGVLYSVSFLIEHPNLLSKGTHLPSPAGEDYIRFTIAIVLTMQMVIYVLNKRNNFNITKAGKCLFIAWFAITTIYLHLQAAKSGLLCFYLLVIINVSYYLVQQRKYSLQKAIGVICISAILLSLSIAFLPSVKKQTGYLKKEWRLWKDNSPALYKEGYSVIPRLLSYKAAWESIKEKPLTGIGAGDLKEGVRQQYANDFQKSLHVHPLIPHNQYLCSIFLIGIPLSLFLLLMIISPFKNVRKDVAILSTSCIMIAGTMVGAMLEVQNGVFVYLFFTLYWMSALRKDKKEQVNYSPSPQLGMNQEEKVSGLSLA